MTQIQITKQERGEIRNMELLDSFYQELINDSIRRLKNGTIKIKLIGFQNIRYIKEFNSNIVVKMQKINYSLYSCSFLMTLILSIPITFAFELSFVYDGNGNLITGDGKYREYNGFNQLIRVSEGNSIGGDILEEYIYDPIEDRVLVKRFYDTTPANENEVIVYVNDNFVRKYNIKGIREIDDTYYAKDESGNVGEIVFNGTEQILDFSQGEKLFYHNDHLGSTSLITNETGELVEETFYSPYGEILSGGGVSRYQYEGKEFSSNTKDYDFNFRKYNPELGIFTQPDAVLSNVYDPQSLNRYSFERNNPYKYVDEDGKVINLPVALGAGLLGGVVTGAIVYYQTGNTKQTVASGSIAGGVTALSIATLGASTVAFAGATTTGARLGVAGITGLRLFSIGQTGNIVKQRFVEGEDINRVSIGESYIAGGANALSPLFLRYIPAQNTLSREILSQSAQQLISNSIEGRFVDEIFNGENTFGSPIRQPLDISRLFGTGGSSPYTISRSDGSRSSGDGGGFTPNYGFRDRLRGCGVIMSCPI